MAGIAGKSTLLKFGTTLGGAFTNIADLNSVQFNVNGEILDISAFAASYMTKIQGLKSWSVSGSGFWSAADTNGQVAARNTLINDTACFLSFLPDGTTGFKGEVKISSWNIGAEVNGVVSVDFSAEGSGSITAV